MPLGATRVFIKYLLLMKLVILFLIAMSAQAFAHSYGQGNISIKLENVQLKKAFRQIEAQGVFRFVYRDEILPKNHRINIAADNLPVDDVLQQLLENTSLSYRKVTDNLIVITNDSSPNAPTIKFIGITGRVTNEEGQPLGGVSVQEKGTSNGTTTAEDGSFSLQVTSPSATLVISYVGYDAKEVTLANQTSISVQLAATKSEMQQVVVVAYGTQKKATVTGSVASINAKELNTTTTSNLTNMMAGKLPGLRVTQRTSEPGSYNTYFDIRGMGNPLIVVDGVVRDDFNKLDPYEIESVSILKDASAAVYGVKAANGVVLITTKKGKAGKSEVSYSGTYGVANLTNSPEIGNAVSWMTLTNENKVYTSWLNSRVVGTPTFTKEQIEEYANGTKKSTDWAGLAIRNYAPQQHHNITLSGGTDKLKYFVSTGYYDEQGLWKSGDLFYKRYNFRSNLTAQLNKNLDAELLLDGIVDKKTQPGGTSDPAYMIKSIWMQIPTLSVYANDNPLYLNNAVADGTHPLAITSKEISGYIDNENKSIQGSLAFNYKFPFLSGLKARGLFSYYNS